MTASEIGIDVQQVTKKYSGFILEPTSFQVRRGEIVGLVGENGAGKTTLLSIILNRRLQDSGSVFIEGVSAKSALDRVGFVLDSHDFHGNLCPIEISSFLQSIYRDWDQELYLDTLDLLHVERDKTLNDMSRGTKSKAMLAIAISHNPSVLILDEITSGLDPAIRREILELLKGLAENNKLSIIFSTHIPNDIEKIADRVCFLHKGAMAFDLPLEQARQLYAQNNAENLEDLMVSLIKKGGL